MATIGRYEIFISKRCQKTNSRVLLLPLAVCLKCVHNYSVLSLNASQSGLHPPPPPIILLSSNERAFSFQ